MARYEIRESPVSQRVRDLCPDSPPVIYVVWDTAEDKAVPFGSHSDPKRAERDRARREARGGA